MRKPIIPLDDGTAGSALETLDFARATFNSNFFNFKIRPIEIMLERFDYVFDNHSCYAHGRISSVRCKAGSTKLLMTVQRAVFKLAPTVR